MRKKFSTSILGLLLLSGCASIEAGDEVKDLNEATTTFADALKAADTESADTYQYSRREEARVRMLEGDTVRFEIGCEKQAFDADQALVRALRGDRYDRAAADAAYADLGAVETCDLKNVWPERVPVAVLPSSSPPPSFELGPVMASGSGTLSGTARQLQAYVKALADVATGETAGKTDEARSKLVSAGNGLLESVGIEGALPFTGLANTIASSIIAAKRNRETRRFLDEMDGYMPTLMERIGLAARIGHSGATLGRAQSAERLANWANDRLNAPDMFRKVGKKRVASQARIDLYDQTVARLAAHNEAMRRVALSDPMQAARGFAAAHGALTEVYHDPKKTRRALAQGLHDFQEAAAALHEALVKDDDAADAS
jgi:hypothetical protein